MQFLVATDGACKGNPGPGTWAFVVFDYNTKEYKGHVKGNNKRATNNEMELTAIVKAVTWATKHGSTVEILTDSSYCLNGITKWMAGWKKRGWKTAAGAEVKNLALWKQMDAFALTNVTFTKVKGHSGNRFNDAADMYCNEEYTNVFI